MSLLMQNLECRTPLFPVRASVQLGPGITGLSGASGSGKTTLLEMLAGLRQPSSGRIVLGGRVLLDLEKRLFRPPWQRRLGYVPQDQALFPHWTAGQNLACGRIWSGEEGGLMDRLRQLCGGRSVPNVTELPGDTHTAAVLDLLELEDLYDRPTPALSGGERARVALGRALLGRPEFLLLDEPLVHLDDRLKQRTMDYLRRVSLQFGLPMLLVSHSAMELATLCPVVLRMEAGELVA